MMADRIITITIEQISDGWHVVVYVDGEIVEASPPIADHLEARRTAQRASELYKAKFARVALN